MYKVSQYTQIKQLDDMIVAFNTYSGSVARIDENLMEALTSNPFKPTFLNSQAIELLVKHNFIVPVQLDEYQKIIDQENRMLLERSETITFVVAPTLKCNFSCSYCFEAGVSPQTMNSETIHDVISFIKSRLDSHIKTVRITWFGGEPLLALDVIKIISHELIMYCNERDIKYFSRVITNGYFLTESSARMLHDDCNVRSVQVTLDGYEKAHEQVKGAKPGTYKRIIDNINKASKYLGIAVRLNIPEEGYAELNRFVDTLMQSFNGHTNIRLYLAEVCEDWSRTDNKNVYTSPYWRQRWLFDNYVNKNYPDRLTNEIQLVCNGLKCGLIKKGNAVIGPEGELYRCEQMIGRQKEIIGSCKYGLYHNKADCKFTSIHHPEKCRNCIIFPICMTECPNDVIEHKTNRIDCNAKKDMILHEFVREFINNR